jgi:hypothetical protein
LRPPRKREEAREQALHEQALRRVILSEQREKEKARLAAGGSPAPAAADTQQSNAGADRSIKTAADFAAQSRGELPPAAERVTLEAPLLASAPQVSVL